MDILSLALGVLIGNLLYLGVGVLLNLVLRPLRMRKLAKAQVEQVEAYRQMVAQFGSLGEDDEDTPGASPYL